MANYTLDIFLIVVFAVVQWRITRLVLRSTSSRLARYGIFAFNVVAAVTYSFTFSILLANLPFPTHFLMVSGAASLAYFMTATAMMLIHGVMQGLRRVLHADVNPGRRRVLNVTGDALMVAPFAVMGYGALVQRTDFRVREVDLRFPNLHPDLDNLSVLQLSDIHLSAFLSEGEFARVVDASRELNPNLIVVTGDLISGPQDPLDACIRQLTRLKSDAGIYGCMGNHERYAKVEAYTEQACARRGIRFLRGTNQQLTFGSARLNLAGCDFNTSRHRELYLAGMQHRVIPGDFNVILQHNPDVFPVAARQGYNLLLAGHTHGGQVQVEILEQSINPARFFTPFVYGEYREGNAAAYVTRGIGTIGVPARIGAPPEITLLRLRKA